MNKIVIYKVIVDNSVMYETKSKEDALNKYRIYGYSINKYVLKNTIETIKQSNQVLIN